MDRKTILKKTINLLGNIITVLAIFFIIKKLFTSSLDYSIIFNQKNIVTILCILFILSFIVITNCFPWKKIVELFSNISIPWNYASQVYVKSNLLKYIPGNIFQYVGRNELASKLEISHMNVAISTITDIIFNILAAVLLSSIYLFSHTKFLNYLTDNLVLIISVLLLLFFIIFLLRNKIHDFLVVYQYIYSLKTLKITILCLFYYFVILSIQSLLFVFILLFILNVTIPINNVFDLFSAYTFSWLVGFLTPGAPAGIGIREVVMTNAVGGVINTDTILFALVIFRVLTTLSDCIAYLFLTLYYTIAKKK